MWVRVLTNPPPQDRRSFHSSGTAALSGREGFQGGKEWAFFLGSRAPMKLELLILQGGTTLFGRSAASCSTMIAPGTGTVPVPGPVPFFGGLLFADNE